MNYKSIGMVVAMDKEISPFLDKTFSFSENSIPFIFKCFGASGLLL